MDHQPIEAAPTTAVLSHRDLLALVESGKQLASLIGLDDLLGNILQKAVELTDSNSGTVYLPDPERSGLYFAAARGSEAEMLLQEWGRNSAKRVPLEGSKAGAVFTSGQSIVVNSLDADEQHYKGVDRETQHTTKAMVCVPLAIANERIGALQILDKSTGSYNERDRLLLEHFGSQAAVAIRNATLFADLITHSGLYGKGEPLTLLKEIDRPAHSERLTLLFADLRSFTQLCNTFRRPEQTVAYLNEFLSMLSEAVLRNDGLVNKFLGDGLLAIFRGDGAPRRAVKCAFEMLSGFERQRESWKGHKGSLRLDFLDVGIGIATDEAIFGRIGSSTVRDVTAIGAAVNLAAALEKAARGKDRRVLVDSATFVEVEDMVAHKMGPEIFKLGKPDQAFGIEYDAYAIVRLKPESPVRVFISHNHRDWQFVEEKLIGPLDTYGIETWYSKRDVFPGDNYITEIEDGFAQSDWVLIVVSRNAITDWVKTEIRTAFAQPRLKTRIVPIVIDGTDVTLLDNQLPPIQRIDYDPAGRPIVEQLMSLFARKNAKAAGLPSLAR